MNHKMDADSGLVSLDSLPQMVLKEVADRALDTNHLVFGNVFNGLFSCPFGIIAVGCHLLFVYFLACTELNLVA